jgi:glutamate/aspartate transport system substrate-binding protein
MIRSITFVFVAVFAAGAVQAQALDGRLKKIAQTKTIAIAYRSDAMPFAFADDRKQIDGFSIDLCRRVANSIERQLNIKGGLQIKWVPVTVQSRFEAVAKGRADMECGSSTITLSRLKQVDFSSIIFVETTGLLVKTASGVKSLDNLSGKKIAVIGGTTNERAINAQLKRRLLSATVVPFKSRDEAFAALEEDKADAFASDKLLLVGAVTKAKDPRSLTLLTEELSFEPYGIVLPRGDSSLRLAVNTGLAQLYSSGQVVEIFRRWFEGFGQIPSIIQAAYILGSIPE